MTLTMLQPTGAQAAEELTLQRAVKIALLKNLDIQSAKQEQVKARGGLKVAEGALYPSLTLKGGYTRQKETAATPDEDVYNAGATVSFPLYQGGKLRAYLRQAYKADKLADSTVEATREEIIYAVYAGFYDILLQKANVATARDALAYAEDYLEEVKARRELGMATTLEVTRAEKLLVGSRQNLIAARNGREQRRIDLLKLLRLQGHPDTEIDGMLSLKPVECNLKRSLEYALDNRPDLEQLRMKAQIQEDQISVAKSNLKPQVTVAGTFQYDDPSLREGADKDSWYLSLNVEIPVYDSGVTEGRVTNETAKLEQARQAVEQKLDTIEAEVRTALLNIETARNAVAEAEKNLELARESLRLADVGYREGVGTQLDVLDARAELTEARTAYSAAVTEHNLALAQLRKAEGRMVAFAENRVTGKEKDNEQDGTQP
ncbi:MAG: TolC family protein [Synergistales bacterium]|nr:TolC family protein [Synergistales bacterium]